MKFYYINFVSAKQKKKEIKAKEIKKFFYFVKMIIINFYHVNVNNILFLKIDIPK